LHFTNKQEISFAKQLHHHKLILTNVLQPQRQRQPLAVICTRCLGPTRTHKHTNSRSAAPAAVSLPQLRQLAASTEAPAAAACHRLHTLHCTNKQEISFAMQLHHHKLISTNVLQPQRQRQPLAVICTRCSGSHTRTAGQLHRQQRAFRGTVSRQLQMKRQRQPLAVVCKQHEIGTGSGAASTAGKT
jgi:hypothetical protein